MISLWEILVPTIRRVGGKPYRTRFHRVWDDKVRAISGGLTIYRPVKGQWFAADGVLHAERMIPVRIACTEEEIRKIAAMTRVYYDQIAVMVTEISRNVFFVGETDMPSSAKPSTAIKQRPTLKGLEEMANHDPAGAQDASDAFWRDVEETTGRDYDTIQSMVGALIHEGYEGPSAWDPESAWTYQEALDVAQAMIRELRDIEYYDPECDPWHCHCPNVESPDVDAAEHHERCPFSEERYVPENNATISVDHLRLSNFKWYADIFGGWP